MSAAPAAIPHASSAPANAGPSGYAEAEEPADVQDEGDDRGRSSESAQPRARRKRLGVDPSLILSEQRSKRRKTPSPEPEQQREQDASDRKDPERAKTLGMQIYQQIMEAIDPEGHSMAEPFVRLPSKRSFPDYYETIKHPMSLEMVHKKLEGASYETLKAVVTDLGQIFTNAKRYNVKESMLFQYAKKLHKMVRTFHTNITSPETQEPDSEPEGEISIKAEAVAMAVDDSNEGVVDEDVDAGGLSGSADGDSNAGGSRSARKRGTYMRDGPTVYKMVKPVIKSIKEAKARDGSGREIAGIFLELPDRKDFADYYKTIKNPLSIQEIEERMIARAYETFEQFTDDVGLMCQNAFEYNEDESEVFRDATQIMDILAWHQNDIKTRASQPPVQKFRVKPPSVTPARTGGPPPSASVGPDVLQQRPPGTQYSPSPSYSQQPQPSAYPPSSVPAAGAPSPFLPALPAGVVTEDLVASLARYPEYEQQAWASTLPPLAMQMYRQMVATNAARRRMQQQPQPQPAQAPPPAQTSSRPVADLPSSARLDGRPSYPNRSAPPLPTVKCIDFTFSTPLDWPGHGPTIRLYNMRGVVTHAVIIGLDVSELALTAYVADDPPHKHAPNGTVTEAAAGTVAVQALESVPEVSLRVNGNQGSLPRFIFEGEQKERPAGMRWTVGVPHSRTEMKIEVVATKPGSLAETSAIFVSRQY